MRFATRTSRWLIRALLITLPWLPLGAAAEVGHGANATMSCLHMDPTHPAPDCQQHDSTTCLSHCALDQGGVGLLTLAMPAIRLHSTAPHPVGVAHWSQRHTPPPLRPPRLRLI